MEQKKYMDIIRIKESYANCFQEGDDIVVQEKVDGSNAMFSYDIETDTICAFSRRLPLSFEQTLNGFWNWTQTLDINIVKSNPNWCIFGEWLQRNKIVYPQDAYKKFYCFDIWDREKCNYLHQDIVEQFCEDNNLIYVPTFYKGKFTNWDNVMQYVGQTQLGGDVGEGVVLKNLTRLNDPNSRTPFYLKIVSEKFQESMKLNKKIVDPLIMAEKEYKLELTKSIVTENRISKILTKMCEDDIIPYDWSEQHMKTIAQNITKLTYADCVKEENDIVLEVGETFGKLCASVSMSIVRKLLNNQ